MAAAAEGDDEAEIPRELIFYWNFKRYGNPWPGKGWAQWPMGLPTLAAKYESVYTAFSSSRRSSNKVQWVDSNPEMNEIFTKVFKLKKEVKRRGNG